MIDTIEARPVQLVLLVAASCLAGLVWGVTQSNWILVAAEIPSVLALFAIAGLVRYRKTGSETVKAASVIGLLCAAEVWIATAMFDAHGLRLAVIFALSTGFIGAICAVAWWRHRPLAQRPHPTH